MHNQCDRQVHTLLPLVMICSSSGEHPHFSTTAAEWLQEFWGGGEGSGRHNIEQGGGAESPCAGSSAGGTFSQPWELELLEELALQQKLLGGTYSHPWELELQEEVRNHPVPDLKGGR